MRHRNASSFKVAGLRLAAALVCLVCSQCATLSSTSAYAVQKEDQLAEAVSDGDVRSVQALLQKGTDLNDRDDVFGGTLLERAIMMAGQR